VFALIRLQASMAASFGCRPRRSASTIRNDDRLYRFDSPRPVEPAAPISPSTYSPAPRIGESPTRPGIFQARPLVVVTPQISPLALMPLQLIVPYRCSGSIRPSLALARAALRPAAA